MSAIPPAPDDPTAILDRIANGKHTEEDIAALGRLLSSSDRQVVTQLGKYNVNIGTGKDIHIGDRTYITWNDEAIQALIEVVQKLQSTTQTPTPQLASVDDLVQQVRSRLHDNIQRLHGTMPLWGVDRWVPLGDLFVDVNILEELSSSRKSELDDLWQDFSQNPSYRSLDRIGLGKERKRVSGLEVLAKNTNLMVVGKPGSGKTTYLQRVVTECNAGNLQAHRIPLLIKLREFVEDGREVAYSLERYLERCWRLSDAETQLVLDQGRALVLLDGLDEVTGEDGKNITKEIKRFARAYPQVQVIVTCRTQSQESRFERFDYVEVADFNEPQVQAFAEHGFKTVIGDELAGLARAREFLRLLFLEENKPIRELAITPILLSLTCAVFHQTGKFYSKRSKLYEEGLELLLEQWNKSRSIERDEIYRDLPVERKLELLSYLAVKKFEQPKYVLFEQGEIEGYIAEFLRIGQRDSRVMLRAIEAQHGLLIERSKKVWSFSHLTFQEYFVAKWFCSFAAKQNLVQYVTEVRWSEVFLIVVEILHSADEFILLLKQKIDFLVASNYGIQKFLQCLHRRASSVAVPYKLCVVRAFYFTFQFPIETRTGSSGGEDLDFSLCDSIFLGHSPDYISDTEINIINKLDEILTYKIFPKFSFTQMEDFEDIISHDNHFLSRIISSLKLIYFLINTSLIVLFKLPFWIFYLFNFWTSRDKELIMQYYDANKLLVACLNSGCVVSDRVREEIEETLLLPIAEIENRRGARAGF